MKALRIEIKQSQAHYRRAETMRNRLTYPLPPFSTIIGALHNACGFTSYQPMDISVQGKYGAMQREPYVNHAVLDSVMDDRGILVKLKNPHMISAGYEIAAAAQKSQGNSFAKETTIDVCSRALLDEYKEIRARKAALDKEKKETVSIKIAELDAEIKAKKKELEKLDKADKAYGALKEEIKKLDGEKKKINAAFKKKQAEECDIPYSYFATLVKSLQYYEVLYDVELVIYVRSSDEVLQKIQENIFNLTAIGRSEDFADVISCEEAELERSGECHEEKYSMYISRELMEKEIIFLGNSTEHMANGTMYALDKDYVIENKKRKFNKKWVFFSEDCRIDEESWDYEGTDLYFDKKNNNIVNFM